LIRLTGLVIVAILSMHSAAAAEIRLEERDGVLYVRNVEPTPGAEAPPPSASPAAPSVAQRPTPYRDLIRAAAARHSLAPELVESVIRVESNFKPRAVSPKGARGLMQLMPATAAQLGVRDVFDVRENIDAGVRHLRYLLDLCRGNVPFALAAYNAGVDAVARYSGIPPYAETQAYVSRILRLLQEAGIPTTMDGAVSSGSAAASRTLYRYEAPDGRVVYSNLPIDRLSEAARAMLRGR
jgi:soluble lytic murein transglycosylase-like protein